ncbi:MAG: hypothetical protein WC365_07205 [Candidatus Babeliales bacterium]|jgi:hypothetical protein
MSEHIIINVIAGASTGIGLAIAGYLKTKDEEFDYVKLAETAVVGVVIGGAGGFLGLNYDNAITYLTNSGAITVVQYGVKVLVRKVLPKIKDWLISKGIIKSTEG